MAGPPGLDCPPSRNHHDDEPDERDAGHCHGKGRVATEEENISRVTAASPSTATTQPTQRPLPAPLRLMSRVRHL